MNKVGKLLAFQNQVRNAAHHYGYFWGSALARSAWLLARGFSPKEILLWGLLNPGVRWSELRQYVSKQRFLDFQARISPPSYAVLLEDKNTFHALCDQFSIPTPEVITFLGREGVWTKHREFLPGAGGLSAAIAGLDDTEFILKPSDGVYGRGIRAVLLREGRLCIDGRELCPVELLNLLQPNTQYLLQRRLWNHPEIERLTGAKTLQALRVVTVLPERAATRAVLASASWRVVGTENVSDNFDYGHGGNMRAGVDPLSGELTRVIRANKSGFGTKDVIDHPKTGIRLLGARLPMWAETRELIQRKAACFRPIRMVGWDIGLTEQGPVILEGNFWFDPGDNAFGTVATFMERVANDRYKPASIDPN